VSVLSRRSHALGPPDVTRCMTRPPRIIFVVNEDWFFVSHRLPLARACLALGYDVALCAGESESRALVEREGIRFFPLSIDRGGTHPVRDAGTLKCIIDVYRAYRPDIAHHVTIKPVLYGSIAARVVGVPGVVNAVSGLGYAFIPRQRDRFANRALRVALQVAYRAALSGRRTRVIFQNEDDRSSFVAARLVDQDRTRLIPGSGVSLQLFSPTPLPAGDPVALVPSRLLWDKGIGEFVDAARLLRKEFPRARFVLLGRIDTRNPAAIPRGQVQRWVADGLVEWWPACSHAEMPERYQQAHVVVLPSYREGLPLCLAEAAASARAVITTDVPGCRETVVAGRTGWLVPARDAPRLAAAMRDAFSNSERLQELGAGGRSLARQRFDVANIVERTLATYAELL
jgi:glycosyltransferase involved in cell wall biosynthesis